MKRKISLPFFCFLVLSTALIHDLSGGLQYGNNPIGKLLPYGEVPSPNRGGY